MAYRVCIDPGHSGPVEPGVCAGGVRECDIVLEVSRFVADYLRCIGVDVMLTRDGDIDTDDLDFRVRMANDWPADVYISIHANAAENTAARGVETYHYPGSPGGEFLASCIQRQLVCAEYTVDRGVKSADFYVLRETNMPAVLVEVGFVTNATDREILTSTGGPGYIAAAIALGLRDYIRTREA